MRPARYFFVIQLSNSREGKPGFSPVFIIERFRRERMPLYMENQTFSRSFVDKE